MRNPMEIFGGFWLIDDEKTRYGQLGDYVGGVWGTIISAITLALVYVTWMSTRRVARLQSTTAILAEMLKTHDAITESGEYSFWDRRGTPSLFLREFAAIYRQTRELIPSDQIWPIDTRIDIAYTFAFYGLNTQARHSLQSYGDADLKRVQDAVSGMRRKMALKNKDIFKGHQATLSHYLRNLFGMYTLIDKAALSQEEKIDLSKIVRTKLSNYDQALLALNVVSHMGRAWEVENFINKYKPFSNVPPLFFGFDEQFDVKARFPLSSFEWEQAVPSRPTVRTFTFRRWTLRMETRPKPESIKTS